MAIVINGSGTVTGLAVGGLPDGTVDAGTLATDSVSATEMASGTDGNIISYDASGNPVAIATGSDGQVLTSTGAGSPPAFETAAVGGKVLQVVEAGISGTSAHSGGTSSHSTIFSGSLTNVQASSVVIGWINIQGFMGSVGSDVTIHLFQGSRIIGGGTAANSDSSGIIQNMRRNAGLQNVHATGLFIDSSPPTGTVQYDVKCLNEGTLTVGRGQQSGAGQLNRTRNNIILMEIQQ